MPMTNLWRELPPGPDVPRVIYVVVEIPKRSRNKYEYDEQGGFIKLDRVLYSSLHYPGDYGFIPQTLAEDHDPLDILVMVNEPTFPGCLIEARVVGIIQTLPSMAVLVFMIPLPYTSMMLSSRVLPSFW